MLDERKIMSEGAIDFSLESYKKLTAAIKLAGYAILRFGEQAEQEERPLCLLRHDVDADMSAAHKMGRLEYENSIASTFFVMLRSPLYNLFGRENARFVEEMLNMGHQIGLHYDAAFLPHGQDNLIESILTEIHIIERSFGILVKAVSFHQPNEEILKGTLQVPGRINTYSRRDMQDFLYISDSNRRTFKQEPSELFRAKVHKKVQFLVHPMWWVYGEEVTTEGCWDRAILANFSQVQQQLLATERAYGSRRRLTIEREDSLATK